jgi:hypothetical protein
MTRMSRRRRYLHLRWCLASLLPVPTLHLYRFQFCRHAIRRPLPFPCTALRLLPPRPSLVPPLPWCLRLLRPQSCSPTRTPKMSPRVSLRLCPKKGLLLCPSLLRPLVLPPCSFVLLLHGSPPRSFSLSMVRNLCPLCLCITGQAPGYKRQKEETSCGTQGGLRGRTCGTPGEPFC